MTDRFLTCLFLLLTVTPVQAEEGFQLTARQAVERARERIEFRGLGRAAEALADTEGIEARVWPNPVLEANHERNTDPPFGESETSFKLSQRLDFSGERGFRISAAEHRGDVIEAEFHQERNDYERQVISAYFQWVFHTEQVAVLGQLHDRLSALDDSLQRRVELGQSSEYDLARLRAYSAQIDANRATIGASEETAREELLSLTGLDGPAYPSSVLLPPEAPDSSDVLSRIDDLPLIQRLTHSVAARERESQAERRAAVPDLTLGIGQKRIEVGELDDTGLVATLAIELPVFDRRQALVARAEAKRLDAEARLALEGERLQRVSRAHLARWRQTRRAYLTTMARSQSAADETVRLADLGFEGGELDLFQLIDALRTFESVSLARLDLAWQARQAAIKLYPLTEGALQ